MKNKVGIHYGSLAKNWMEDQLPLIPLVKELGFDFFEFGVPFLVQQTDDKLKSMADAAAKHGVGLGVSLGLTPAQDVSSSDAAARKAGIELLKKTAAAMKKVGAKKCSGIVHGAWNFKPSSYDIKKDAWKYSVQSIKEAVKAFEDNGVILNVEVVNRFENFLINDSREAIAYVKEVGSPNIGVHLDTFHMNIEEKSMVSSILDTGKHLKYFHIGENNRQLPGLGNMPWREIFDALAAIGYDGEITMEPFVHPGGEIGSAVSLYREIADTSKYHEDLKESARFVKALLK